MMSLAFREKNINNDWIAVAIETAIGLFLRLNGFLFGQICILNANCLIIMIAFQLTLPFKRNSLIGVVDSNAPMLSVDQ